MVDAATQKRALEILANPLAKETEWMGALSILDGKVPVKSRKCYKKWSRFAKRVSALALVYTVFFSVYGLVVYGQGFYWSMIPAAIIWATLETTFGAFSLLAAWVMFSNLASILTLNPYYQSTWMVILINMFAYSRYNWRPYVFVPIRRLVQEQAKPKLLKESH